MKKEPVHEVLGNEFGLLYKEKIKDNLWVKIYRFSPYEYHRIVDDDGFILEEGRLEIIHDYKKYVNDIKMNYL